MERAASCGSLGSQLVAYQRRELCGIEGCGACVVLGEHDIHGRAAPLAAVLAGESGLDKRGSHVEGPRGVDGAYAGGGWAVELAGAFLLAEVGVAPAAVRDGSTRKEVSRRREGAMQVVSV